MRRLLLLAAIIVLLAAIANGTVFHSTDSIPVPEDERQALAQAACLGPRHVKVEASSAYYRDDKLWARARCKPHDHVGRIPMQYDVTCVREDGAWDCFNAHPYYRTWVGRRELRFTADREIVEQAYGVARFLVKQGKCDSSLSIHRNDVVALKTSYHCYMWVQAAGQNKYKVMDYTTPIFVEVLASGRKPAYRVVAAP